MGAGRAERFRPQDTLAVNGFARLASATARRAMDRLRDAAGGEYGLLRGR